MQIQNVFALPLDPPKHIPLHWKPVLSSYCLESRLISLTLFSYFIVLIKSLI